MDCWNTDHVASTCRAINTAKSVSSTSPSQKQHQRLLARVSSTETRNYSTFATRGPSTNNSDNSFVSDGDTSSSSDSDCTNITFVGQDEASPKVASWSSMPRKGQLTILTFARLSEPLTQTSLQAYLFSQLQSYDSSLPASTISTQAGIMQGSFTAAQFLTAVWWGAFADMEVMGRKRVMLIGLAGTCISCLGFAFSKSFAAAITFRVAGGVLNSNVGVLRTMIAEIVKAKDHQALAFLILPMCFNVGVIIGPIFGGSMADPLNTYPGLFGPGTWLGGSEGVQWMKDWPFALPNIFNALVVFMAALAVFFGLEETHEIARNRSDWGLKAGMKIKRFLASRFLKKDYQPLSQHVEPNSSLRNNGATACSTTERTHAKQRTRPTFREVWTRNLILVLIINFLLGFHTSAFNSMTFTFLPTPQAPKENQGLFHFGGGLGLDTSQVGFATAMIGILGLPLQIFIYPYVQSSLGILRAIRVFLPFSVVAYALLPFVVILPRMAYVVWPYFVTVILLQVISRTFALPAGIILINNCISNPLVLGTVHGVAQSVTSAARTLGPVVGGWGLGLGLKYNLVGAVWWALAAEALLGWLLLWTVHLGNGLEEDTDNE